ncbi:MAG: HD domain-containing protein [Pseudomonadota bacterium]
MTIGAAFEMALAAHAGQTDKSGEPYIAHVVRVAAGLTDPDAVKVALLHDVVEDCDVTLQEVEEAFGPRIASAVDAITKRDGEAHEQYLVRVAADPMARAVKLSDLADNTSPLRMARLDDATRARLEKKYAAAIAALT